jgi:hypothetical protein
MIRFLRTFEQGGFLMNYLKMAAPALMMLLLLSGAADAQKKKKSTAKKTTPAKAVLPPLDVRAAREKVSIQLDNVNNFVDKLGPIAQDLDSVQTGEISKAASDKVSANKQKLISAIRGLRDALSTLESEFRTKPALSRYLIHIRGITDLAAQSEDSALAGRFVAAKDPLRTVAQKLTDTLRTLPASPAI